jgi:hypothetical protein
MTFSSHYWQSFFTESLPYAYGALTHITGKIDERQPSSSVIINHSAISPELKSKNETTLPYTLYIMI